MEENQLNKLEDDLDLVTDPSDWSLSETKLACFTLARIKYNQSVKMITKKNTHTIYLYF
jgi:hypothetical protein